MIERWLMLQQRGKFVKHPSAEAVTATVHPSAILRIPDPVKRQQECDAFVRDLVAVRRKLTKLDMPGSETTEVLKDSDPAHYFRSSLRANQRSILAVNERYPLAFSLKVF